MRGIEVIEPGPLTTTQDRGRSGRMRLGVARSGPVDRTSMRLANRLVGNDEGAVVLEVTFGGLRFIARAALTIALTGATAPAWHNGRRVAHDSAVRLGPGDEVWLDRPAAGIRTYVAFRGGLMAESVLGSASTDTLSGLGPPALTAGAHLLVGPAPTGSPPVDHAPQPRRTNDPIELPLLWGPRDDWLTEPARRRLLGTDWTVSSTSNRIGLRLSGETLDLVGRGELLSEGVALGAVQVPPQGQPILFLADHPVTGGYPVVGVVDEEAIDAAGQAVPGQIIRFRPSSRLAVRARTLR